METIDQDPNDIVLKEPVKTKTDLPFKIATCVFAATTILFGAIAFFNSNKPSESKKDENESDISQTDSGTTDSEGEDLTLKNFDVNIAGIVNALGFSRATISTLKTNAAGTYIIGEATVDGKGGFAYRKLPDGKWTKAEVDPTGITYCETIDKDVMEILAGITFKGIDNSEAKCTVVDDEEDNDDDNVDPLPTVTYTLKEALDKGYYK